MLRGACAAWPKSQRVGWGEVVNARGGNMCSGSAMPSLRDIAKIPQAFCLRSSGDVLVCRWHRSWNKVTPTPKGVTGWATVVRSLNHSTPDNAVTRTAAHVSSFKVWRKRVSGRLAKHQKKYESLSKFKNSKIKFNEIN